MKKISMTIPDEFHEEITDAAYKKGCITVQDYIKLAVRRYLDLYNKPKSPQNAEEAPHE